MKVRAWCCAIAVRYNCFELISEGGATPLLGSGGARRMLVMLLVVISLFVYIEILFIGPSITLTNSFFIWVSCAGAAQKPPPFFNEALAG